MQVKDLIVTGDAVILGTLRGANVSTGGGGGSVIVDSALSSSSTNPVQNKVITAALNGKAPSYSYGTGGMTSGSSSLATGVIYIQYE